MGTAHCIASPQRRPLNHNPVRGHRRAPVDVETKSYGAAGYQVTMISDANVGQSFGLHEASLSTFFRVFGDVRPSDEVVDLINRAARR